MGGEAAGEGEMGEDHVLHPVAHVAGAAGADLGRQFAGQRQDRRDVVRAEAPERVLVGAQPAEVEPLRVDVANLTELAGLAELLQRRQRRW